MSTDETRYVEASDFKADRAAIDPEEAYRAVCGYEVDKNTDMPAFRQGMNDYADSMVKSNEWITLDNGESYYSAQDVKEFLAEYPPDEYEYTEELRSAFSFFI